VRRIAYVGMTRAMDELTITVSGEGPIGTAIQSASR
jgi:superfamily I DNA/RNA helicase